MSFIPYGKQDISPEDIDAVISALKSDFITTGPRVRDFEQEICRYTGSEYATAVSNGTAALHLASLCLLKKGDKVLTTPNTFLATVNSIVYAGAIPVFADILPNGNINLDICEKLINKDNSIKAVYAVHFSGNPCDYDKLRFLKEKYNILILEDCAHSLGAYYHNSSTEQIMTGSSYYSDCSILSFHPVKHLTTGEGGAVTTNNREMYEKLLKLRNHGMTRDKFLNHNYAFDEKGNTNPWYYEMQDLGFNYRITDFQCALGISQFKRLNSFIDRRKQIALLYENLFRENKYIKPLYKFSDNSSYHLYIILIDFDNLKISRAELMNKLKDNGIGTQVHYIPVNKQPFYQKIGYGNEETPVMDKYYQNCLSIPIYSSMSDMDVKYVADGINQLVN